MSHDDDSGHAAERTLPDVAAEPAGLSRRAWLGNVTLPALGLTLGAARPGRHDAPPAPPAADTPGARVFNIRDFGAKGDGMTLDTAAVQAAIDACHRDSGGTVLVPAGVFHVGTLELKSNVTLYLAAAGTLLGSADGKQYHAVDAIPLTGDSTLGDGNWALIFAVGAQNVTIDGPGMIDGQGIQFHPPQRGATPPSGLGGARRPYHLLFYRCEHLRVRNVRLYRSAFHSVRVIQSKHVEMHGLHIHNRVNGNNDGFHFVSAEHVAISNCTVECQDDACALFGSCQYVTVTNCYFSTRWSVFRFGGGHAAHIAVSNCTMHRVYGCPFKFNARPGSIFEHMSFSNIVLEDVTGPIHIGAGPGTPPPAAAGAPPAAAPPAEPRPANLPPAVVRNISFSNVHGTVTTNPPPLPDYPFTSDYRPGELHNCITLNAVGGAMMERISFDDVHLVFGGDGTAEDAARRDVPQIAGEYFMLGSMPAYGLYARNVRALTLQNVRLEVSRPDLRPAVVFDHVSDAAIGALSVQGNAQAESVLRFTAASDVLLTAVRVLGAASAFLQLEGTDNRGITVDGGDLSKAARPLAFRDGATAQAVTRRG